MSYVTPNSTIQIFKNIPWDNTYQHTLYFPSLIAQNDLFNTLFVGEANITKYGAKTFNNYMYQRKTANSIKVAIAPDSIYDYNYMRFKNTSHGNKWFYAFITEIEYVNENTAIIFYELDVIQTYFNEMQIRMSYVEREHTLTDFIGENIEAEPIDFKEYVNLTVDKPWNFDDYKIIMFYAEDDVEEVDLPATLTIMVDNISDERSVSDIGHWHAKFKIVTDLQDDVVGWQNASDTIVVGDEEYEWTFKVGINELWISSTDPTAPLSISLPVGALKIDVGTLMYGKGTYDSPAFQINLLQDTDTLTFTKEVNP